MLFILDFSIDNSFTVSNYELVSNFRIRFIGGWCVLQIDLLFSSFAFMWSEQEIFSDNIGVNLNPSLFLQSLFLFPDQKNVIHSCTVVGLLKQLFLSRTKKDGTFSKFFSRVFRILEKLFLTPSLYIQSSHLRFTSKMVNYLLRRGR